MLPPAMGRQHLLSDFGEPDRHRDLRKGEYLFRRGDAVFGAFVLESGRVELVRAQQSGAELALHRVHPGASFAEAAVFGASYHCDCRAEIASRLAVYSSARVASALQADPTLALAWARRLADQVRDQRALLEVRSLASAGDRILAYLGLPAQEAGGAEPPSLRALAAELGLAEETVYRAVARLEREGAIVRRGAALRLA
jgi:CRP-like cAMP-binding protein